jgi:type II secretory pathway pseudopilin PulG
MKKYTSHKAFTLIEILIAGAVLGGVVFAVLRMSINNSHQVSLLETENARKQVDYNIEQCIRSLGFDALSNYGSSTGSISF